MQFISTQCSIYTFLSDNPEGNTIMKEHYISSNSIYSSEKNLFFKNGSVLRNDKGIAIKRPEFNSLIKKETSSFIHKSFNNIIVLIGAGASVLCVAGTVDKRFGKTVSMLATLINDELKLDSSLFTLQQLADLCKYDIPVEITEADGSIILNSAFNLEDFLSNLLSFEKYVSNSERDKYVASQKNSCLDYI